MYEVETKILDVDSEKLKALMLELGAFEIQNTKLVVDWFGPKGLTHNGDDPWFLRIRSYSDGKSEVTWKGKSEVLGVSRKHKEINFTVSSHEQLADLFLELDLELYAHQEKFRISWTHKDWRFDLDQYPKMPAYLEIEGNSEQHIQEAIELLTLQDHAASFEGERLLIQKEYGLNWNDMKF